jgi:hypothetical protein
VSGTALLRKTAWGLLAAAIVGIISRSPFLACLAFSFVAGGALIKAYWVSLDDKA